MDDLTITRLCAEAMGLQLKPRIGARNVTCGAQDLLETSWGEQYDPLHDDAQAMALVKKFNLALFKTTFDGLMWSATKMKKIGLIPLTEEEDKNPPWTTATQCEAISADLNRAICECVARMQQAAK